MKTYSWPMSRKSATDIMPNGTAHYAQVIPTPTARVGPIAKIKWGVAVLALMTGFCGCQGPQHISMGESRSPDAKVIAKVYRDEPSGIGTGQIDTVVNLNWTVGSQSPTTILAFDDGLDMPEGDKHIEMKWTSPASLDISYIGNRHIGFQASQWHGVQISVHERQPSQSR